MRTINNERKDARDTTRIASKSAENEGGEIMPDAPGVSPVMTHMRKSGIAAVVSEV